MELINGKKGARLLLQMPFGFFLCGSWQKHEPVYHVLEELFSTTHTQKWAAITGVLKQAFYSLASTSTKGYSILYYYFSLSVRLHIQVCVEKCVCKHKCTLLFSACKNMSV